MARLLDPVKFLLSALFPFAILLLPVVLLASTLFPKAVLLVVEIVAAPIPIVKPFTFKSYAPRLTPAVAPV